MSIPHSGVSFAHANGIHIAYDTFGSPDAASLLLIMGLSSQMIMWEDDFCCSLADRGLRVIRFDNRDMGMSTRIPSSGLPDIRALFAGQLQGAGTVPYTLHDMAEDTIGLMDALDIEAAHVAGVSMGGMISQEMAIHHAGRLKTLTSIMSTTGNPLLPPPRPEAIEILFKPIPISRLHYVRYFMDVWRILSGPKIPMDEATLERLGEESYRRGVSPAASARQLAAIIASGSRKEGLKTVRVPTLVIHGDQDPLVTVEGGIDTAESIPGARLKIIPGMGHALSRSIWPELIDAITGHVLMGERNKGSQRIED